MDEFWEYEDSHSEMRYIVIELMKIASQEGRSFEEVAEEFVKNTYYFKQLLEKVSKKKGKRKAKT